MKLELVTLTGIKMNQDVYEVTLPTESGEISILPGHERLVTLAVPGAVSVRVRKGDKDDARDVFAINGGVVEIVPDRIRILVDEADAAEDIAENEAKEALKRAQDMKASAKDSQELEKAQAMIDRSSVRLKVAGLRRRHR